MPTFDIEVAAYFDRQCNKMAPLSLVHARGSSISNMLKNSLLSAINDSSGLSPTRIICTKSHSAHIPSYNKTQLRFAPYLFKSFRQKLSVRKSSNPHGLTVAEHKVCILKSNIQLQLQV